MRNVFKIQLNESTKLIHGFCDEYVADGIRRSSVRCFSITNKEGKEYLLFSIENNKNFENIKSLIESELEIIIPQSGSRMQE